MIYWLIGQPGSGKSTLARRLKEKLDSNNTPAIHLDGDDLRKIFEVPYTKENLTKEYRITQTKALQRFVAHIADQGINVVVSTVNPYKDIREEFKNSRKDIKEIYVTTDEVRGREHFHVKDFEMPKMNYIVIITHGKRKEDDTFEIFCSLLRRKVYVTTITADKCDDFCKAAGNVKTFDSLEEKEEWVKAELATKNYGEYPSVYVEEKEVI